MARQLRLCQAPSFSKGVASQMLVPFAPRSRRESRGTPSAHVSISGLQNAAAGGGTWGWLPPPPAIHHLGVGKGGTGSKTP